MTNIMKLRYRHYRRHAGVFYLFDNLTGMQESLNTKDSREAARLLHAKNEALVNPQVNRQKTALVWPSAIR